VTVFLCAVPIVASLFSACAAPAPLATGYVEGDYVLIAPVAVAQIEGLSVARGDRFSKDQVLVRLEHRDAEIARAQAEAAVAMAQGELDNLREGKRPEEIRVIEAALTSAKAQAAEYERQLARLETLTARGAATEAQREDAQTAVSVARAKVAETEANLSVARLPARPQQIAAAEAGLRSGQAGLAQAIWALEKRTLTAPADGIVSDVIRQPGEIAGPSAPVLSILPDHAVKLRLYIPENRVAELALGDQLAVRCDSCAPGLRAQVTYIADGPEFTPPVIYSLQNRQKLVYLVEAQPVGDNVLKPGQIVDVDVASADNGR
jgi:HlyD family secretion protein